MTEASVKKEDDVLFIFDLNSITTRQHLEHEPISLAVFTELVNIFKDIGLNGYLFKYVANENLIICDSKALTIEYMNSLKDKVKAEYKPLIIEKVYEFKGVITHKDLLHTEIEFIRTYNVEPNSLISTSINYDNKTITIKSKSGSVKRAIPYYVAKLVESCVYITDYNDKMEFNEVNKPVKYPYRELIKESYETDFTSKFMSVGLSNDKHINLDIARNAWNEKPFTVGPHDVIAANNIKAIINEEFIKVDRFVEEVIDTNEKEYSEDFSKVEFDGYVDIIDDITDDDLNEFFENRKAFNEFLVAPNLIDFNPINYNQTEAAHKVAEALINESKAVSNMFNISDFAPPYTSNLYSDNTNIKDEVEKFLTPIPANVEELLDETRAYEALAKIRLAKAESRQDV